jgi:hypothetical protein
MFRLGHRGPGLNFPLIRYGVYQIGDV